MADSGVADAPVPRPTAMRARGMRWPPRRLGWLGALGWPAIVLGAVIVVGLLAPLLAPADPLAMDVAHRLATPSPTHWLGQDEYGRDMLSRLIYGARIS